MTPTTTPPTTRQGTPPARRRSARSTTAQSIRRAERERQRAADVRDSTLAEIADALRAAGVCVAHDQPGGYLHSYAGVPVRGFAIQPARMPGGRLNGLRVIIRHPDGGSEEYRGVDFGLGIDRIKALYSRGAGRGE